MLCYIVKGEQHMEIGSTLRASRIRSKMTVEQISKILTNQGYKASQKTVYSWENGNSKPDIEILMKLCDIYEIRDVLGAFGYNGYKENRSLQLNMKEVDMVEKYRDLDPHGKKMVDFTLNEEWEHSHELKSLNSKIASLNANKGKSSHIEKNTTMSHLLPDAAHDSTNMDIAEEMIQHDEDIMNDANSKCRGCNCNE